MRIFFGSCALNEKEGRRTKIAEREKERERSGAVAWVGVCMRLGMKTLSFDAGRVLCCCEVRRTISRHEFKQTDKDALSTSRSWCRTTFSTQAARSKHHTHDHKCKHTHKKYVSIFDRRSLKQPHAFAITEGRIE
jgi:hypothetical protein